MKFDDFISQAQDERDKQAQSAQEDARYIIKKHLQKFVFERLAFGHIDEKLASDHFEPVLYAHTKLGFKISTLFGMDERYFSSFEGYDVTVTSKSTARVEKKYSHGKSSKMMINIFAEVDARRATDPEEYRKLIDQMYQALENYHSLCNQNYGKKSYIKSLKKAFYEKIDDLSDEAARYGVTPVKKLSECKRSIVRAYKKGRAKERNKDLLIVLALLAIPAYILLTLWSWFH